MTEAATFAMDRANVLDLRSLEDLRAYKVLATDGEIGKIADFHFDDSKWTLRYSVVDTGGWLKRRRVLVSPQAFRGSDGGVRPSISTNLTRKQIEMAPHVDTARPVSRQVEITLRDYFKWQLHGDADSEMPPTKSGDPHLRSVTEVLGYGIEAKETSATSRT